MTTKKKPDEKERAIPSWCMGLIVIVLVLVTVAVTAMIGIVLFRWAWATELSEGDIWYILGILVAFVLSLFSMLIGFAVFLHRVNLYNKHGPKIKTSEEWVAIHGPVDAPKLSLASKVVESIFALLGRLIDTIRNKGNPP